jgi:hypothetical protein
MTSPNRNHLPAKVLLLAAVFLLTAYKSTTHTDNKDPTGMEQLRAGFLNPPPSALPGVYWYFMDGNLSAQGMTEDLESMKKAGIGNVIFLEVNLGVPLGKVDFLSDEWYDLFKHAVDECKRLGIRMTLGIGPGWAGSGGSWVAPAESMQHLVSSTTEVSGSINGKIKLPIPLPKKPYFGEGSFNPTLKKEWQDFYEDVAVLAFPTPAINKKIDDIDDKALYYRAPYSSAAHVQPFLPDVVNQEAVPKNAVISKSEVIDLTDKLQPDGTLSWKVPKGNWTIMRFGRRNNGAVTRPAPLQGLGFESDKFDTVALNKHLDHYVGKMIARIGPIDTNSIGGLKFLHIDSWEMGSQNWTSLFRQEFIKRRGYDPLPFYPVYAGNIIDSREISERFLWDLRQTSQELVLDYHAGQVKKYSHRNHLGLSIEPYDMNPTADLELGAVADIPMCEFWSKGFGFNTSFSCIEATSIAHISGEPVVQAEAFTAGPEEAWRQYPGSMKDQSDWAFAMGINRFFYHTFEHKPLADSLLPGMTMGPYGVHWDRKQTWWPMVADYHNYVSRCQFVLQQGRSVADILYLTPEGAPMIFTPPPSSLTGNDTIPDRRGYNFDGCSPGQLHQASVKDGQVVFPGGATYRLLVLPYFKSMTPALLKKIQSLVKDGATVICAPPLQSPSLTGYPTCDQEIQSIAKLIWGDLKSPAVQTSHPYGKGRIIWGGNIGFKKGILLYPDYDLTAKIIKGMGVPDDFESTGPLRYTHRTTKEWDIYFVSNRSESFVKTICNFRTAKGAPELWDPLTGKIRALPGFFVKDGLTTIPLQFDAHQSFFVVFSKDKSARTKGKTNFPTSKAVATLNGPWAVSFDPKLGGPEKINFDRLTDWTLRPEKGIKYYSGIASYTKDFDLPELKTSGKEGRLYLNLGEVKNLARVILNGHDLGVLWTTPWQVDVTGMVKRKDNHLKIEVANLWPNRLIGDQQLSDDGIKDDKWPEWVINKEKRKSGRYTFTTSNPYKKDSPLLESGLIGPVTIQQTEF